MKWIVFICFFLSAGYYVNAQNSKKEFLSFHKALIKLDTTEIREGKHLELARNFSIEEFVIYYIENGSVRNTKKMGRLSIVSCYNDSASTYFVRKNMFAVVDFFNVNTSNLNESKYEELDGEILRKKFIDEVVPESDKKKVARRSGNHMMMFENPKFSYFYNHASKRILFTYKWKLNGDLGIRIINKTYNAEYDIATKKFITGN